MDGEKRYVMKINIENAVKSIKGSINMMNTLYETIANSIDANARNINVTLFKSNSFNIKTPGVIGYQVEDDGDGFTEQNTNSFLEYMSGHKKELGCKGVGRFTWLKIFDEVRIESYTGTEKVYFKFHKHFDSVINREPYLTDKKCTKVYMVQGNLKEKYMPEANLLYIKNQILRHFISKIYLRKSNNVELNIIIKFEDEKNFEMITLDSIPNFNTFSFEMIDNEEKKHLFEISYSFCNIAYGDSQLNFCGNDRVIKDEIKELNILGKIPEDKVIISFVKSELLNENVNESRTEFVFNNKGFFENGIEYKNIVAKVKGILEGKILDEFPIVNDLNMKVMEKCINANPHLAKYIRLDDSLIKDEKKLLENAQKAFEKEKKNITKKLEKILSDNKIKTDDFLNEIDSLTDISNRELAQYILFRQKVIDCLKKFIDDNEKIESLLHNLFAPMRKCYNSNDVDFSRYDNNIWLLDDKFMSYKTLYSDINVKTIKKEIMDADVFEGKISCEPDITIFYSQNKAVIIEFKGIGASYRDKANAYIEVNRNSGIVAKNIPNIDILYNYIITEIDDNMIKVLDLQPGIYRLFTNSERPMYYYFNDKIQDSNGRNVPCHTYFLSTSTICDDANERNKFFLEIIRNS